MTPHPYLPELGRRAEEMTLDLEETRRYGRHLVLPEVGVDGQKRLKAARVLLVGAGGLGSPLALYLAAAGVGTLGLVDDDVVDITNLQRQVLYGESYLGRPKLDAAADRLRQTNPRVALELHRERLDLSNVRRLVDAYDVIVDGSDNFPTRYLVHDACHFAGKPDVWAAVLRFEGQAAVFWSARGPCYRCLFPEPPPPGLVPSCAEGGVLGVLPGMLGGVQATETLKLILGVGEPLLGRLLLVDALRLKTREIRLSKNPQCPLCGPRPTIHRLTLYDQVCEHSPEEEDPTMTDPIDTDHPPYEIQVEDLKAWRDAGEAVVVLDVREPHEHRIGYLEGAQPLPLGQLPHRLDELDPDALVVTLCHHGQRSARAMMFLRQQGFERVTNLGGGIDAWSLRIDPSIPRY